ncbi:hypothetical protein KRX51_07305 [Corynebacterium sp. TAE3-ERU12]|uniref:hypothetical protein n=1 Tax=Corynebacterium sp. TAE3-ERU12 TaxID=2849491 RepID=UPI001C45768B|nr:hypothetical protein [Corynebacterium sp. TAE3-ERU12]MBV7295719.1 hypothetical protein [Corynebacterium sp. TAE3-ERU12]
MPAPAPARLAAGLAVTAVEEAFRFPYRVRRIPQRLTEAGETAVSNTTTGVLSRALRVQQDLSQVMAKGEVALEEFTATSADDGAQAVFEASPDDIAAEVQYDELDTDDLEDLLPELSQERAAGLLTYEKANQNRPAYCTLLANAVQRG